MQGTEERRLRRTKGTPQGEATEGNAADDTLMVDQGRMAFVDFDYTCCYIFIFIKPIKL